MFLRNNVGEAETVRGIGGLGGVVGMFKRQIGDVGNMEQGRLRWMDVLKNVEEAGFEDGYI